MQPIYYLLITNGMQTVPDFKKKRTEGHDLGTDNTRYKLNYLASGLKRTQLDLIDKCDGIFLISITLVLPFT